ncbi:MAG: hypothetical protein ACLU4J_10035 [Butyricimonas paravirosa]
MENVMAYAAGIIILLSLGLWFGLRDERKESVMQVAVIEPESFSVLILNDGQKVALEKGDTLISAATSNISVSTGQVSYKEKKCRRRERCRWNTTRSLSSTGWNLFFDFERRNTSFLNSDSELHYPVRFGRGNRKFV